MKKAVIFDLDGTVVNSIPVHMKKDQIIFKKVGVNLKKEYFYQHCNGKKSREFYREICMEQGITGEKKIQALIKKGSRSKNYQFMNGIKTFPHIKSQIKQLKKNDYKLAIASSSGRDYVKHILKHNNLTDIFDVIVSGSDTKLSKPDPSIFLLARKKLNIKKAECVIIEDALQGFIAAKRAGIDCIGVTTSLSKKEMPKYVKTVSDYKKLVSTIRKL